MKKPGFKWLTPVLCVNDVPRSLKHYSEVLGFDIEWEWSEPEAFEKPEHATFASVCRGECAIFLCEKGQGTPGAWLCLNVSSSEELDTLHKEYQKSGAKIVQEPQDYSWGMREMIVEDLDGNTFRMGCAIEEK